MRIRRLLAPLALAAFACVALVMVTRPASSQLDSSQTQATGAPAPAAVPQPDPPGTIDGSKNPELIPDDAVYRLVLLAFSEPENPTAAQLARFRSKIAPAGLSDDDTEAFRLVLGHMQTELDGLRAQENAIFAANPVPHPDSTAATQLAGISQQRESVFAEAMSALPARLSASGAAKLHDFIQKQKHGMKVFPDMPTGPN
jgi:hypothetical protein